MALIDPLRATSTYKDILIVVCHSDNFMRHNLSNRENQIKVSLYQKLADLSWPRIVHGPIRDGFQELRRDLSQCHNPFTPIVFAKQIGGDIAKHLLNLR